MSNSSQLMPPLEWVRVFEAAGRLGSFTAAAEELGLTQAAVSQRIRNLELRVGAQLFSRQARGVTLSTQGEAWLPHVQHALGLLATSAANLFEAPRRKVTVAASASVIELWFTPRLAAVAARLPHMQLAFETVQNLPDYETSGADLDVRFGNGIWPDREARRLFPEELAPVASPGLTGAAKDWQTLPQIAVSGPRMGWRDWSQAMGQPPGPAPVLRFDTFVQGLRAAEAGAGVILGALPLCRQALEEGRLQRLTTEALSMETGYWLSWPRSQHAFAELPVLADCLCGNDAAHGNPQ